MTMNHLPVTKSRGSNSPMALLMDDKAATFRLSLDSKGISIDAFKGAMIGAALRDPKLMECVKTSPLSLLSCAQTCAELGLMPGAARGEVYLIPRNNSVKRGGEWTQELQCTLLIGYRGLAKLALQHPKVERIQPVIVYKDEPFSFRPAHPDMPVDHIVQFGLQRNPETMIGGYCLGWLKGSRGPVVRLLDMEDFEDARSRNAKEGKKNAWDSDYEAMCLKTLIRRICNLLPTSTDLEKALEAEDDEPQTATISTDLPAPTSGVAALENDARLAADATIETGEAVTDAPSQGLSEDPNVNPF